MDLNVFKIEWELCIIIRIKLIKEVDYEATRFIETDTLPPDSKRVGEVWEKSNKDGNRDKQFAENRQFPVMEYGEITFKSSSGIYEKYMFSNAKASEVF